MAVYLTTIIGDQYQLDKENCTNSSLNIVGSGSVVAGSIVVRSAKIVHILDKFAISIYINLPHHTNR